MNCQSNVEDLFPPMQLLSNESRSAIIAMVRAHIADLTRLHVRIDQLGRQPSDNVVPKESTLGKESTTGLSVHNSPRDASVPTLQPPMLMRPALADSLQVDGSTALTTQANDPEKGDGVRVAAYEHPENMVDPQDLRKYTGGTVESNDDSFRGVPEDWVRKYTESSADSIVKERSERGKSFDTDDSAPQKKANGERSSKRKAKATKRHSYDGMFFDEPDHDTPTDIIRRSGRSNANEDEDDEDATETIDLPLLSRLRRVVRHPAFEIITGLLIATNGIFIGIQIDFELTYPGRQVPLGIQVIHYAYVIAFAIDLVMRLLASGCKGFFYTKQWKWNYLDLFVVLFSLFETIVEIWLRGREMNMSILRILRFVRMARLARVVRVGRLLDLIRPVRVLIFSILGTMKIVCWAVLLLVIIIYMFSLVLAQSVGDHFTRTDNVQPEIALFWGTLPRVMFTLFKSVMGGLSWHECVLPLATVSNASVVVFLSYICVSSLAVLNVITGVFCQSAIEGAEADRDLVVQKHMAQRKEYVKVLKDLFGDIDTDESNVISLDEFTSHLVDEEAKAFFNFLDIEIETAWEIFHLLDGDGGGTIDVDEFISGCLRLRGYSTALDLAHLRENVKRQDKILLQISKRLEILTGDSSRLDTTKMVANLDRHL